MNAKSFKRLVNIYPPFLGAGVRVRSAAPDFRHIRVEMRLRWYNRNYVGTHFGGSLYSMVDPFYMLMLMQVLGPDYIVWDQAARIAFLRPGRGTLHADFHLTEADLAAIHTHTHTHTHTVSGGKYRPQFVVEIRDLEEEMVARVEKTLYVRRRNQSDLDPSPRSR